MELLPFWENGWKTHHQQKLEALLLFFAFFNTNIYIRGKKKKERILFRCFWSSYTPPKVIPWCSMLISTPISWSYKFCIYIMPRIKWNIKKQKICFVLGFFFFVLTWYIQVRIRTMNLCYNSNNWTRMLHLWLPAEPILNFPKCFCFKKFWLARKCDCINSPNLG